MKLTINDFQEMIGAVKDIMVEKKDYLVELDAKMGDGDLGLSMSKGFTAAAESINQFKGDEIGKALFQSAMAMNNAASSTMGTLLSSGLMNCGKEVKEIKEAGPAEQQVIAQAFVDGVLKRSKAKPGEKTVLDALLPAVTAFKENLDEGKSLKEAIKAADDAATSGVESTKEMTAQHGRSAYYGEKSKGNQDPGATVIMFVTHALLAYFQK